MEKDFVVRSNKIIAVPSGHTYQIINGFEQQIGHWYCQKNYGEIKGSNTFYIELSEYEKLEKQLKEANEIIKTRLPPVFDTDCEGCREALRHSTKYVSDYGITL